MIERHPISVIQNVHGSRFMLLVEESTSPWRKLGQQVHFSSFSKEKRLIHQQWNTELANFQNKQHRSHQLVNETTSNSPTFQWNNANLADQPLSILSFFLQTKRNCWTCFFPDSRQCCTMGKTPSCLLLILALDKMVCFQYCTHTSERRKSNRKKLQ